MKKLLVLSLASILAVPVIAMAQEPAAPAGSQSTQQPGASQTGASQGNDTMGQPSGKAGNVKGTVSQDGKTLVGDDGKSWTIANPDAVKGHEGHHVELKGSADASTSQIQVSSVKMLKGDKMKKDSSQPQ